jgi:hypothetical protein
MSTIDARVVLQCSLVRHAPIEARVVLQCSLVRHAPIEARVVLQCSLVRHAPIEARVVLQCSLVRHAISRCTGCAAVQSCAARNFSLHGLCCSAVLCGTQFLAANATVGLWSHSQHTVFPLPACRWSHSQPAVNAQCPFLRTM